MLLASAKRLKLRIQIDQFFKYLWFKHRWLITSPGRYKGQEPPKKFQPAESVEGAPPLSPMMSAFPLAILKDPLDISILSQPVVWRSAPRVSFLPQPFLVN